MNLTRSLEKRTLKFRSMLFDPANLSLNEQTLAQLTQRNPELTLENDRLKEVAEFFDRTEEEILATQTPEAKALIKEAFSDVSTDPAVLNGYRQVRINKIARMMLGYTRFPSCAKLLQHVNSLYPPDRRGNIQVLDYGCGVSDYGLAFAVYGYAVTIADIQGGHLDFAEWRYQQRNLTLNTIAIHEDNVYPELGAQDLIIAGEVFEHLRDPLRVIQNMHAALPKGGLLWYSGYPNDPREVGHEHLVEAGEQREEALAWVNAHFKPATQLKLPGYLYKKV